MSLIIKDIRLTAEDSERRLDVVVQSATGLSRAIVRGMLDHGCVSLNGTPCHDGGEKLPADSIITLRYDPKIRYKEKPQDYRSRIFTLIYEDAHLLVVNKAAGFLTVPTSSRETNTVVEALRSYVNRGRGRGRPIAIVHRLDRDTSGLLVFAKTEAVAAQIKDQFAARKPEREYLTIVAGRLPKPQGSFRSYLATDKDLNQHSTTRAEDGKLAITHYQSLENFADTTLVKVTLETGRRNQIRVHFAEHGHPVLGDQRYETAKAHHALWPYRRLALHAAVLGFRHPITGEQHTFRVPMPHEFSRFIANARRLKP